VFYFPASQTDKREVTAVLILLLFLNLLSVCWRVCLFLVSSGEKEEVMPAPPPPKHHSSRFFWPCPLGPAHQLWRTVGPCCCLSFSLVFLGLPVVVSGSGAPSCMDPELYWATWRRLWIRMGPLGLLGGGVYESWGCLSPPGGAWVLLGGPESPWGSGWMWSRGSSSLGSGCLWCWGNSLVIVP